MAGFKESGRDDKSSEFTIVVLRTYCCSFTFLFTFIV